MCEKCGKSVGRLWKKVKGKDGEKYIFFFGPSIATTVLHRHHLSYFAADRELKDNAEGGTHANTHSHAPFRLRAPFTLLESRETNMNAN